MENFEGLHKSDQNSNIGVKNLVKFHIFIHWIWQKSKLGQSLRTKICENCIFSQFWIRFGALYGFENKMGVDEKNWLSAFGTKTSRFLSDNLKKFKSTYQFWSHDDDVLLY